MPLATATPTRAPAAVATVDIINFTFVPASLEISVGTTVRWTNQDNVPHTSTSEGVWDTGELGELQSGSFRFDEPGVYNYICTIHPFMQGTITVK